MAIILADIISRVESDDNQFAIRFEPAVFNRADQMPKNVLDIIMDCNKCSQKTAQMIYATSFGKYQIMGFNLYSPLEYRKTIFEYANSLQDQFDTFSRFVAVVCKRTNNAGWNGAQFTDTDAEQSFARFYNGPNAIPQYMARMEKAASDLLAAQSEA